MFYLADRSSVQQEMHLHAVAARSRPHTSESESVLRYLLKKLLLLFNNTLSSSVLVMFPLCIRYMPKGLFTKKG